MTGSSAPSYVHLIGETAGVVWHTLNEHGPMTLSKLVTKVGKTRDLVMQAVGWLAREDKIWIHDEGKKRVVSLK